MIDRVGLDALPPAKRAELIYGAAQAEMSKRLWQAALGGSRSDTESGSKSRRAFPLEPAVADAGSLDALMAELARSVADRGAATDRSSLSVPNGAPSIVTIAPARLPVPASRGPAPTTVEGAPVPIGGLGPNLRYADTLAAAAERVGVPAPALAAIVDAEAGKASDGSWKIYSRNPRSSAAGLGQFLNRTWEGLAETRGTWLHDHAARQGWLGSDGQVRADSRAALLAARYDPTAAINGIADYARHNLNGLHRAGVAAGTDVVATARFAYLTHHLGLGDAIRFLRGNGLGEGRARMLLDAQVGVANSARRIATMGDATTAHREWLVAYLDRNIRPDRFSYRATV